MKRMTVLWFVNMTPDVLARALGKCAMNYQGWISGLRDSITHFHPEIDLNIACLDDKNLTLTLPGTTYHTLQHDPLALQSNVKKLIQEIHPDIIHFHGSEGVFPALPKGTWGGTPICMSLQGIINGYVQHYLGGIPQKSLQACTYPCKRLTFWLLNKECGTTISEQTNWKTARSAAEACAFKNVSNVLGRTDWDREWTRKLNPSANYFHVGEILRPQFYRGRSPRNNIISHSIYASACASYPLKGAHLLFEAIAILKRKYPDVKLTVADSTKLNKPKPCIRHWFQHDYTIYLRNLIEHLKIKENLRLLQSLTADEVSSELSTAEVFCLPSSIENSPNSLSEAAMTGTPIIATNVGGIPSLVNNGKDGLLVNPYDPQDMANAIDKIFSQRDFAMQLAQKAYELAVRRHNPESVSNQLFAAYAAIIKRSRQPF